MMILREQKGGDSGYHKEGGGNWDSQVLNFLGSDLSQRSIVVKSFVTNFGSVDRSPTMGSWGVGGSYAFISQNPKTSDLVNVNVAGMVSAGSSGGPRTRREFIGFNCEGPFRIHHDHIVPANSVFGNWVGNDDALIVKSNFGSNHEDINKQNDGNRQQETGYCTSSPTAVETRPHKECGKNYSSTGKHHIGSWSIDLWVTHAPIISQQSFEAGTSVKAVR
jgi:hypothetical protein